MRYPQIIILSINGVPFFLNVAINEDNTFSGASDVLIFIRISRDQINSLIYLLQR